MKRNFFFYYHKIGLQKEKKYFNNDLSLKNYRHQKEPKSTYLDIFASCHAHSEFQVLGRKVGEVGNLLDHSSLQ